MMLRPRRSSALCGGCEAEPTPSVRTRRHRGTASFTRLRMKALISSGLRGAARPGGWAPPNAHLPRQAPLKGHSRRIEHGSCFSVPAIGKVGSGFGYALANTWREHTRPCRREMVMTLERFAELLTEMEGSGLFPTLERHGLSQREWARVRHHWLRRAVNDAAVRRALSAALRSRQTGPSALGAGPAERAATAPDLAAPARALASFQRLANTPRVPALPAPPHEGKPEPDETAMVDLERAFEGQKLPFREPTSTDPAGPYRSAVLHPPNSVDAEGSGTAMVDLAAATPPSLPFVSPGADATAAVNVEQASAARALPFSDRPASADPKVQQAMESLERYEQVVSVLAYAEDRRRALLIFGLTETSWQTVTASWAARIQADPSIKSAFDALMKQRRRQ